MHQSEPTTKPAYYLGFDVGGTSIKYGILTAEGDIIAKDSMPTEALSRGGAGIIAKIQACVKRYQAEFEVLGIAISSHGMIDSTNGVVLHADDHLIPGYSGLEVAATIKAATGVNCTIENDVNCAGLGELWRGQKAMSTPTLVSMLTIGTGIGGCLLQDGKIIGGANGCAGEIGKIILPNLNPCTQARLPYDRFENLAATSVVCRGLADVLQMEPESMDGRLLLEGVRAGKAEYQSALDLMIRHLALGISTLAYIYNPGLIILGGGIMSQSEFFAKPLELELSKLMPAVIMAKTKLQFATLQNDAGMIGALRFFKQHFNLD